MNLYNPIIISIMAKWLLTVILSCSLNHCHFFEVYIYIHSKHIYYIYEVHIYMRIYVYVYLLKY